MFFEMVAEAGLNGQEDRFFEPSGGLANLQASLKLAGLHYTPFDVLATRNFLLRQKHAVVLSRSALRLVPLPLSKLTYIPHHAPTRSFSVLNESKLAARAKLNLHANNFYLITMGHPAAHKYLDDSLEAFAELSLIHDHLRYIIIGRMSESSRVIRTISRLGIGAKVLLQGWVSEPEFFLYCRAADLAVNVRNSYRGETSGVLLRTASCGLPSLVGTSGSAAEMPIDKIFRVQLTSRLKIELRHRINYAIINPRILKNEAIRLIALTQFNYSQTFCAQQYVELVDRIYHGGDSDRQMIGYGHS
jgi:glycosyltransferase involved in cell wall biosynthesis